MSRFALVNATGCILPCLGYAHDLAIYHTHGVVLHPLGVARLGYCWITTLPCLPVLRRFGNCDGVASNGCEVNLNTSVANCGACDKPAAPFPNAAAACMNGARALGTCNPGWVGRVGLSVAAHCQRQPPTTLHPHHHCEQQQEQPHVVAVAILEVKQDILYASACTLT
jgi:hypothetical protein